MKKLAFCVALSVCGVFVAALPAHASKSPRCNATSFTDNLAFNPGYKQCSDPAAGRFDASLPNARLSDLERVNKDFTEATFLRVGLSSDPGFGPFASDPQGLKDGRLLFDVPLDGLFIIGFGALDPGDNLIAKIGFYQFDQTNLAPARWIDFDTFGFDKIPPGLTAAALYVPVAAAVVPEPGTWALGLAALGALAVSRRYRRTV